MTVPTPEPAPTPQPQPVIQAAQWASWVVAVIGVLATGFGVYGAVTDARWALGIAAALTAVTTGLGKVLPTQAAKAAAEQVTPLSSPRGVDGSPLVASASVSPLMGPDA